MENETNIDDKDESMGSQDDYHLIEKLYEGKVFENIDLDEIMVNGTNTI